MSEYQPGSISGLEWLAKLQIREGLDLMAKAHAAGQLTDEDLGIARLTAGELYVRMMEARPAENQPQQTTSPAEES